MAQATDSPSGLACAGWQRFCCPEQRTPRTANPTQPSEGTHERHSVPEEAARGGKGWLPEDRAGEQGPARTALEAPEPRAEAARANGAEASLRTGIQGVEGACARGLDGAPRPGGEGGRAADGHHRWALAAG